MYEVASDVLNTLLFALQIPTECTFPGFPNESVSRMYVIAVAVSCGIWSTD